MRTLVGQAAISAGLLVFGVLSLLVARHVPKWQPGHRYVWALTGSAYLIRGINSAFHDAFATYAFARGPTSAAWAAVLAWHPVLNHSRTFLLVAYCMVLCVALVRVSRGAKFPPLGASVAFVVAGMAVGGLVGWQEEAFSYLTHFTAVASWDAVEFIAMMALLLVGLSTALLDRTIWACVGITAFGLALSTVWFVFLARRDVAGEWTPRAHHIHFIQAFLYAVMNVIVVMQLRRLNRGQPLLGFFEVRRAAPATSLNA